MGFGLVCVVALGTYEIGLFRRFSSGLVWSGLAWVG